MCAEAMPHAKGGLAHVIEEVHGFVGQVVSFDLDWPGDNEDFSLYGVSTENGTLLYTPYEEVAEAVTKLLTETSPEQEEINYLRKKGESLDQDLSDASDEIAVWREAFRDYAQHKPGCASRIDRHPEIATPDYPCDCGFNDWLSSAVLNQPSPEMKKALDARR